MPLVSSKLYPFPLCHGLSTEYVDTKARCIFRANSTKSNAPAAAYSPDDENRFSGLSTKDQAKP
jgi:hypothetical protein